MYLQIPQWPPSPNSTYRKFASQPKLFVKAAGWQFILLGGIRFKNAHIYYDTMNLLGKNLLISVVYNTLVMCKSLFQMFIRSFTQDLQLYYLNIYLNCVKYLESRTIFLVLSEF